ncbi:lysylphosphatidylglycerol synthase domain-containing protein [Rhodopirellula sp. JC639]|uniref:lysylphosphatidylglycerol synthase domain-containing protein n=1 Tax=Stieleria mannarensis TaxID=2755585 RepID=UPI0016014075|nr:lysylphosphatidylglycerol synthase domain-containing protein [Rhodopirellula sp. JC639]
MSPRVKQIARALIAIIVIVGLILATRAAVRQWSQQKSAAIAGIKELEAALASAETAGQRNRIERELVVARSSVPAIENLGWPMIGLAAAFYGISLIPGGLVLYEGTRVLGYRAPLGDVLSAQVVGHLGKYVPGKAMVVVIRAGRLAGAGVPLVAGSIAVFLETLTMMAVGAAVAGGLIFLLPVSRWIAWCALLGGIAATLPTLPPVLKRVVAKVSSKQTAMAGKGHDAAPEAETAAVAVSHDWRFFLSAWFWQGLAWVLIGASFGCLVESLPGQPAEFSAAVRHAAATASIALAMVVGFASLLPGGAGVRELTLAVVLAPVIGSSQALLAAILARLLFIGVELLAVVGITVTRRVRESVRRRV